MLENIEMDPNAVLPLKPADSFYSCALDKPVKLRTSKENLEECKIQTIPQVFHESCQKYKNRPALAYESPEDRSKWRFVTYEEFEKNVEQAALVLLHLGVKPRTSVAILAFNCPEWFYVELGAMRIGAVVAGIYTSNSAEAVRHVLEVSDATLCLVDDSQQMSKVRAIKSRLNQLRAVVQLNGPYDDFIGKEEGYHRWSDSGTVAMPKGVMISHDGILYCSHAITKLLPSLQQQQESAVSYLPQNHIAAQLFDVFMAVENGGLIYFADRNALKGSLGKTFTKSRATMLLGVPRIFEKMQEKLIQVDANSSAISRLFINTARNMMERYHLDKMENKPTSNFKYWLASKVIYRIKLAMGLDQIKESFIGGAPVTEELKRFFLSLDLPLTDVFGMSETSGAVTYNFDRPNLKTVGKPINGVEIKIDNPNEAGEGEILIRGRCNLMGYLKDETKTLETLTEDGWIRSGDMGYMDADNNLYISGRLKEIIITAGGENIPPAHIEALIKHELPCLSNAVVIGDHRKYLTVLLTFKTDIDGDSGYPLDTLRPDAMQWLDDLGVHYTQLSDLLNIKLPENLQNFDPNTVDINCDSKVLQAIEEGIKRYNVQAISNAQKVQYFSILPHDFSIPTNELGPTLKVKRNVVHKKYAKIIEKLYEK
ncbi:hypothetical protein DOY81_008567 [Sarcophaga bullata]|nr:hypothetical protein DOY81_008567 [Sarcophaga bullata]